MKNSFFVLAALLFSFTAHAQANTATSLKASIKKDRKEASGDKKEKKELKKELRALRSNGVSDRAKEAFAINFGDVPNARWERQTDFDEVSFTKDGQQMSAFYDADGRLVGVTMPKTFEDLPAAGQKNIKTKYAAYQVGDVYLYDDDENNETDMVLYHKRFADEDSYFVELKKDGITTIVRVNKDGAVFFYKQLP